MKFSELDIKKLKDEDIYDLVMDGVVDYAQEKPTIDNNPDFLIVLGCSPIPLKARVIKMMQLYKSGYGKYVLFSGGKGWHKLFKKDDRQFKSDAEKEAYLQLKARKYKEMKLALKKTIFDDMKDEKITEKKGKALYKYMGRRLKQTLEESEAQLAYKMLKAGQDVINLSDDRLFFEQESMNTVQNLSYSKQVIDELQKEGKIDEVKRMMIITSAYHCRRSELSFRKYFPDVEVSSCPATLDLKEKGINLADKKSLMNHPYYMQQFRNEISAIINYTKNGSIADAKIESTITDKSVLERIKRHQGQEVDK